MTTRLHRQLPVRPLPLVRRFGLMGEALLVESDSPAVISAAADAFGRFPAPADDRAPLVLRLSVDPPDGPISSRTVDAWPAPRYLADGHQFLVDLGGVGAATADLGRGIAIGRVSAALVSDPPYLRHTVVEAMALSLLQSRGYLAIHASCVVHDGVSLMIQAEAGTGKSTLAYAATRRGLGVLAEDVVFVRPDPSGGPPGLWGAPWRLHLLPDAPALFPELAGLDSRRQMNGEWKLEIDVVARFPGAPTPHAPVGPQVLLERGPRGGDSIERLSPEAAMDGFEALWPWGLPWDAGHEATAAALRAQGVYRVRMSGTPDDAVDLLLELVQRVRRPAVGER